MSTAVRPYRSLLARPAVGRLLATSLLARLPGAMMGLAIVLLVVRATGSYADAGAISATYVVGAGVGAGLLGRAVDRIGRRPVLLTTGVVDSAALLALAVVPGRHTVMLAAVAAVAGLATPPVSASIRSLWPELLTGTHLDAIYTAEASFQEVTFIAGPALVGVLAAVRSPAVAVAVAGVVELVGTVTLAAQPELARRTPAGAARPRKGSGLLAARGLATVIGAAVIALLGLGAAEVAVAGFAGHHHVADEAGLLLAVWSLGSLMGGLAFGTRAQGPRGSRRLPFLMVAIAGGFVLLAVAPGVGWLYGMLVVSGATIAPTIGCIYGLVSTLSPAGAGGEAFGWLNAAFMTGIAAGAALGGTTVQALGARITFLGAAVVVVAGAGLVALRLAARPAAAPTPEISSSGDG